MDQFVVIDFQNIDFIDYPVKKRIKLRQYLVRFTLAIARNSTQFANWKNAIYVQEKWRAPALKRRRVARNEKRKLKKYKDEDTLPGFVLHGLGKTNFINDQE